MCKNNLYVNICLLFRGNAPMFTSKKTEWVQIAFLKNRDEHSLMEMPSKSYVKMLCLYFLFSLFHGASLSPGAVLKLMKRHVLPIDGDHGSFGWIANCWNLEWEERSTIHTSSVGSSLVLGDLLNGSCVVIHLDEVIVSQEFSIESTDDHYFIFG